MAHLLKEADRMLYEAKMTGRNRVMAEGIGSPSSADTPSHKKR